MKLAIITDVGGRKDNQDAFLASAYQRVDTPESTEVTEVKEHLLREIPIETFNSQDDSHILIACVCDGMGGLEEGSLASFTVIEFLKRELVESPNPDVARIITEASTALHEEFGQKAGTTLSLLVLSNGTWGVFHAGDSRVFRQEVSSGNIDQVTTDHTAERLLLSRGISDKEYLSRVKNQLTNAIGVVPTPKIQEVWGTYEIGDQFLVCSDGFWHYMSGILSQFNWVSSQGLQWAVDKSRLLGEKDNATAIGVEV